MKHLFNQNKVKLLIFLVCIIILWQVMRNWPETNIEEQPYIGPIGASTVVNIAVYYEALCPDSKNFIVKQLQPLYSEASSLIDFQFVPYGKASTQVNPDGSLKFECQHGPIECEANMYHACSIEAIHQQNTLMDFISCMISNNDEPKKAMQNCAKVYHLDWEPIQKCFDSPHGAELLKLHGEATMSLRPLVSFIPTITLDGAQRRQAAILKNLKAEFCDVINERGSTKPDICNKR